MADFEIKVDNSEEVIRELALRVEAALEACGNQAVSHAKHNITQAGRIDTGAMINSVNHLVQDDTCYVGTNIEYAIYHEYGTGIYAEGGKGRKTPWRYQDASGNWHRTSGMTPIHFLKNAIANNINQYKEIIKQTLQQ